MGSDKCRRRIVSRGSNVQIEICTCSTSVVHVVAGAVTIRMEKKIVTPPQVGVQRNGPKYKMESWQIIWNLAP